MTPTQAIHPKRPTTSLVRTALVLLAAAPAVLACGSGDTDDAEVSADAVDVATLRTVAVVDSQLPNVTEAVGTAAPLLSATLATKLMATVQTVHVHEGDSVRAGQLLVTLDVRDIAARGVQAESNLTGAEAALADAELQVARMRALFADSAAPRVQLDAAEAGLARAQAAVAGARGGVSEAAVIRAYGTLRAPFSGVVTQRLVDPGAFAAPGMPLVALQQSNTLRVTALVPPAIARPLARGQTVALTIEGQPASGTIEGVVATPNGGLYTVNVTVANPDGRYPVGGSATLALAGEMHTVRLIPRAAVLREGDLNGVQVRAGDALERRWVRLGRTRGELVEVLSGLEPGELVVLPESITPLAVGPALLVPASVAPVVREAEQ